MPVYKSKQLSKTAREKIFAELDKLPKFKKTTFSKTTELAEAYANGQVEGKAREGRIFIDGPTIYSYGKHFPIATRIAPNTYEFNTARYSNTTSKQQSAVRRALETKGSTIIEMKAKNMTKFWSFKQARKRNKCHVY